MTQSYWFQNACQELLKQLVDQHASDPEVRTAAAFLRLGLPKRPGAAIANLTGVSGQQARKDMQALSKRGWIASAQNHMRQVALLERKRNQAQPGSSDSNSLRAGFHGLGFDFDFDFAFDFDLSQQSNKFSSSTISQGENMKKVLIDQEEACQVESSSTRTHTREATGVPEQPFLLDAPSQRGPSDAVRQVFAQWQESTGHKSARLSEERQVQIEKGLASYGLEDCLRAVRGVARSEFHMGANEQRKRYDSLELIFRNADKTEVFIDLELQSENADRPNFREIDDRCMRFYCEFIEHMQTRYHTERPLSDKMRATMPGWLPELMPPSEYYAEPEFCGFIVPLWTLKHCQEFEYCSVLCLLSIKCVNRWAGMYVARKVIEVYGKSNPSVAKERAEWWERDARDDFSRCYTQSVHRIRDEFLQPDPFGGTTDAERQALT